MPSEPAPERRPAHQPERGAEHRDPVAAQDGAHRFHRVDRRSTTALICEQLRAAITSGALGPGAQLSEAAMAAEFGVSRGPLREAMQRLVQEGLLRSEPHRGLFVKELDEAEVRDLYTARAAVESAAALLLARNASEATLRDLHDACARMGRAADAEDLPWLSDADLAFHELLVGSAASPRLRRMHDTLIAETRMCLTALQGSYRDPRDQVREHSAIVEAIAEGSREGIGEAIETHMQQALERLVGTGRVASEPAGGAG